MLRIITVLLLLTTCIFALDPSQQQQNQLIEPGKIIVKYKKIDNFGSVNKSAKIQLSNQYGLQAEKQIFEKARNTEVKKLLNLNNVFVYQVSKATDIFKLANKLNKDPNVEYAEPVYINKANVEPNDPMYSSQQHLPQVSAPEAWDDQFGDSSVIIAVIDSGVDWDHEDLAGVIWSNDDEVLDGTDTDGNGFIDDVRGWDFVDGVEGNGDTDAVPEEDGADPDNDPMDFGGHGSHVAGISAAHTNNSVGIASVSSGARVMPIRIGWQANDGNGYGYSEFMAQGFIYAADNGAHIANLSYGNSGQTIIDAAFYAFLNGVLIVESAGNDNLQIPSALGSQDWTISVASVDPDDGKSSFSNYGEYIDVSSPGSSILSTVVEPSNFYSGKYARFSGTSMAAPLVASVAGLVKAKYPELDVVELYTQVVETAVNIDAENPSYIGLLGSGRVDAANALGNLVTPKPRFLMKSLNVIETSGNGNGVLEPGEQANLEITIENRWGEGSNINVNLSATTDWPVTINDGNESISNIASILDTANSKETLVFSISVDEEGFPSTVEMELNFSGNGIDQTIAFQLGIAPQLLFVADFEEANDGEFDFSSIYKEDFRNKNIAFDYVHRLNTEITYEMLSDYKIVVWACEWNFPSLTASDREAIEEYLDNGGSLFISGQDIGWELNESDDNVDVEFFENYLKARYLADDAGENSIFGVEGDPISDGITETPIFQIRRPSSSQYPDEIEGLDGAVPIFNYNKGTAGAIRFDGDYQLVYFGFGGYEALTDDNDRRLIMKRIINWFAGLDYELEDIMDTEETDTDIDVSLTVNTEATLNTVRLFYDTDGEVPYESVDMTNDGSGVYTATIPGQPEGTNVTYFANIVTNEGDNLLTESKSFYVGVDLVPPEVNVLSNPLRNSINRYGIGTYKLTVEFIDNFAIDQEAALLIYQVNDESPNSEVLTNIGGDLYAGSFSFDQPLNFGDQVSYYFSASDVSSNANTTYSDTVTYIIDSTQVVDDFELQFFDWSGDANWGLSTTSKTGSFSLSDSPIGSYENNSNTWVMYNMPFDLSLYKAGEISYQLRSQLSSDADSLLFEISSDGGSSWTTLDAVTQNFIFFNNRTVDISEYTGAEFNDVRIRFRLSTNSEGTADGIYIDDVVISVSPDDASSVGAGDRIPKIFELV